MNLWINTVKLTTRYAFMYGYFYQLVNIVPNDKHCSAQKIFLEKIWNISVTLQNLKGNFHCSKQWRIILTNEDFLSLCSMSFTNSVYAVYFFCSNPTFLQTGCHHHGINCIISILIKASVGNAQFNLDSGAKPGIYASHRNRTLKIT